MKQPSLHPLGMMKTSLTADFPFYCGFLSLKKNFEFGSQLELC